MMSAFAKKIAGSVCFLAILILAVGVTVTLSTVDDEGIVRVPGGGETVPFPEDRDEEVRIGEAVREDVRREARRREEKGPEEEEVEEDPILDGMPGMFSGTYRWDDSDSRSKIVLIVRELSVYDEGTVVFCGSTDYDDGSLVVDINGDIDRHTLEIEFCESNPKGNAVTEGVFQGYVTRDLKAIYARWIPFGEEGRTGSLSVEAAKTPDPEAAGMVSGVRGGRRSR